MPVCVWGANTGVGKTVVSSGLLLAATLAGRPARYLKPLQTGPTDATDAIAVLRSVPRSIDTRTLYCWPDPLSPHLAARRAGNIVSDEEVQAAILDTLRNWEEDDDEVAVVVETAGGVLSPASSGTLQGDLYAHAGGGLLRQSVLVGDSRLGGISTTLCAFESLVARGYDVRSVIMIDAPDAEEPVVSAKMDNADFLTKAFASSGMATPPLVVQMPSLPPTGPLDTWLKTNSFLFGHILNSVGGVELRTATVPASCE